MSVTNVHGVGGETPEKVAHAGKNNKWGFLFTTTNAFRQLRKLRAFNCLLVYFERFFIGF